MTDTQKNPVKIEHKPIDFALDQLDDMLRKSYFNQLSCLPLSESLLANNDVAKCVRIDKITKIVYDITEDNIAKFCSVFSSLNSTEVPVFFLLKSSGGEIAFYVGVSACSSDEAERAIETLEGTLRGNFPGIEHDTINYQGIEEIIKDINNVQNTNIASVTGIPSLKPEINGGFSQGLEKIIESLGDKDYTAIFLATPINKDVLTSIECAYQDICTSLSIFNISQISLSQQTGETIGESISDSIADTLTKSIANTDSSSHTTSHSDTKTESYSTSHTEGTSSTVGWSIAPMGIGANGNKTKNKSDTTTVSISDAVTDGTADTTGNAKTVYKGESKTKTLGVTNTVNVSVTTGTTQQYNVQNKRIVEAIKLLDEQLERIRKGKNYGAWNWGVYFIGNSDKTVRTGADILTGILCGEQTGIERNCISEFSASAKSGASQYLQIRKLISQFEHPRFLLKGQRTVTPTSILSTPEVAVGMALPQKSLPGLPVFSAAEFGRSVSSLMGHDKGKNSRTCNIGNVYHLGHENKKMNVALDVDSLAMHTFVTGSTGAGKSNAVYNLLKSLIGIPGENPIHFLVIEPAKGEYKNAFAGLAEVDRLRVYGTNPYHTKLLKINPFSFPENIHIMEHIDRLIEILNAVWPMYSAMPAILKDAVERSYQKCGWNLLQSTNKYNRRIFPDFHDLMDVLPQIIRKSEFSGEVKGNYAGALLTRVNSLTTGYYRTIFQKEELSPEDLFECNCIVDLSRVGSTETKALLMGIVFLKLLEYRIASASNGNEPLKHITVLEEAHNLLKKTSTDQSQDSANLQGKSVEMLANGIAEMRSYGEGFVIADQAPGLLDPAVIRNTNTKIIFRLPDYQDRLLVGKAENLTDVQIDELARLHTGCASVYQNDWLEAILCQFEKFDDSKLTGLGSATPKIFPYTSPAPQEIESDSRTKATDLLWHYLTAIVEEKLTGKKRCPISNQELILTYFPEYYGRIISGKIEDAVSIIKERIPIWSLGKELSKDMGIKTWTSLLFKKIYATDDFQALEENLRIRLIAVILYTVSTMGNHEQEWLNLAITPPTWIKEALI